MTDTNIDTRIDEIFDEYKRFEVQPEDTPTNHAYNMEKRAKAQIKQLLVDVLQEIASVGYDDIHKTYDYDAVAEALLERLAALQGTKE